MPTKKTPKPPETVRIGFIWDGGKNVIPVMDSDSIPHIFMACKSDAAYIEYHEYQLIPTPRKAKHGTR